jgi:hypothetical protein
VPRGVRIFEPIGERITLCPWSFNECLLPAGEHCPIRDKLNPELSISVYAQITNKAKRCKHLGDHLTRAEYTHKQRGREI